MERVHLIVGARAFHRNPYDGHTLNEQLEQAAILMQDCAAQAPDTVFVDLGYRGGMRTIRRFALCIGASPNG